jgi:hypothetical protein
MATVILRTNAGAAHDHAVRNGNATVSPIAHIKLLSGSPVLAVPDIVGLVNLPSVAVHSFDRRSAEDCDWVITEESPTWTRINAHLVESITGMTITGIAIVLENGILWGYAPYLPAQGGLTKTIAFSWTLDLLIVESVDDATPLQLTYEPLDYRAMRDRLLTEIRAELNIPEMAAMLEQAMRLCTIDGNESGWTLDGGNPDPECQLIPIDQQLNAIDGGTI